MKALFDLAVKPFNKVFLILSTVALFLPLKALAQVEAHGEQGFVLPEFCDQYSVKGQKYWDGPVTGPAASLEKTIVFIAGDMHNDGIKGVAKGVAEATQKLGWGFIVLDGKGKKGGQSSAFLKALVLKPSGIVLGGIDSESQKKLLEKAAALSIPVVGWHARDSQINGDTLFTDISTHTETVARTAVCFAIEQAKGEAKAVFFSDNRFAIARQKLEAMKQYIGLCEACELLGVENLSLDETAEVMSERVKKVIKQFGSDITHFIGINDLYFDYARPVLELEYSKDLDISLVSAGDGSKSAYERIRQGAFQHATIPEPLLLQGWQIVDELNRAFNQQPPSGYVPLVHLVTRNNINTHSRRRDYYEPLVHYRRYYLDIWYGLSPR